MVPMLYAGVSPLPSFLSWGRRDGAPNVCRVIDVLFDGGPYCENCFNSIERTETGGETGGENEPRAWVQSGLWTPRVLWTQNGVKKSQSAEFREVPYSLCLGLFSPAKWQHMGLGETQEKLRANTPGST